MSDSPTAIVMPPPYMDPANSQARRESQRFRQESIRKMKACEHCGALPHAQSRNLPAEQVFVWPAARPDNSIRQDSCQFISYVIIIALVIFGLFAACKYLP
uniref:LITAF domain-containing protein n=1 Tax=Caenorhabditis tropicalis TaxID=1561998 RepID=A0A1I7T349_9PELO